MNFKKLLFVGGLLTLFTHTHTHTHTQAQQPKWNLNDNTVDYVNTSSSPLVNLPQPEYTQNAVWNTYGDLVMYEVDGVVYDMNGNVIVNFTVEAENPAFYDVGFGVLNGFTEFIFVPVPNTEEDQCSLL